MSVLELEVGELRHQVKLGRPDVPVRAAIEPCLLAVVELEMMRDDLLVQDVVRVQPDVTRLRVPDGGVLSRRELAQLRHPQLDDESAAGCEVSCRVSKASDLFGLG